MDMKCPICFGKIFDVGDGYECKNCNYFLGYDELDEYDSDEFNIEEYEVYYDEENDFIDIEAIIKE